MYLTLYETASLLSNLNAILKFSGFTNVKCPMRRNKDRLLLAPVTIWLFPQTEAPSLLQDLGSRNLLLEYIHQLCACPLFLISIPVHPHPCVSSFFIMQSLHNHGLWVSTEKNPNTKIFLSEHLAVMGNIA